MSIAAGGPEGGALFTVRLPLTAPPGTEIHQAVASMDVLIEQQVADELQSHYQTRRSWPVGEEAPVVLVVEDNPDMNTYLAEILGKRFDVITAFDGQEGLHTALKHRPDLILSDVMMPRMSGDQMVEILRSHPEMSDIPILMLTAKADDLLRLKMLRGGIQDYMIKPFDEDELLARIEGLLNERRRVRKTIQRLETRFQATFEQAAVGIAHVATDGHWLRVNQKLCDIVGYRYDELLNLTFQDITHPDDLKTDNECMDSMLSGKTHFCTIEKRYFHKNGHIVWVNITASLVRDDEGKPDYFIAVIEDISQRKEVERQVLQQGQVFNSTQEGIVITDLKGCVIDANPAFERITEFPLHEIRGKNMRFLQSGRQNQAFYQSMFDSILNTGSWKGEIWNRRKGGEVFLEWISVSTIYDSEGKPINYVGISTDISRMNHAQSELERLAQHDTLTNLPNRLLLTSRLEHALERVKRQGGMGAVLFIDLDRFKRVNDTSGHKVGDDLLLAVATRLRGSLRDIDTLARLGGDEFVIVLEEIVNAAAAAKVAKELIDKLHATFTLPEELEVHIGGSVGIALFPQDGTKALELISHADNALYKAKNAGRGVYRFFRD